jgi:PDZ domain-containing protein
VPVDDIIIVDNIKTELLMNDDSVPLPPPQKTARLSTLRWALPVITLSWTIMLSVLVMAAVRIQRWELAPGEAVAVSPRIGFSPIAEGESVPDRFTADDGIRFVTAYGGQLSILDSILGWLDPYVQVNTYTEHFGERTPSSSRRLGYQAMFGAKQVAEYVAMKKLGLDAKFTEGDIVIEELVCDGAPKENSACSELEVGDTIVEVNGTKTPTLSALLKLLPTFSIGQEVSVTVIPYAPPGGESQAPQKRTIEIMASPDEADRPIIGFVPADTRVVQLPFDVTISTPDIGGPSAGLAFTLSLLDELTKGNLMGDNRVAATGTINELGAVGAIGALVQKAVAVRDAGVTLFLIPKGQSDDEVRKARDAAGTGVEIVQVASLDDALKVLRARGGDPLPASISMDKPVK